MIAFIIPCAADKVDVATTAEQLYTSANFRHMLASAKAQAADNDGIVAILSAKHGLLALDQVVEPYDIKMGDAGSVSARTVWSQLVEADITDVYAMLPKAYYEVLYTAWSQFGECADFGLSDIFEAAPGIGYQRGAARAAAVIPAAA